MKVIAGGVTAPKGFLAADTAAGIKYQGRTDMAMVRQTVLWQELLPLMW